VMAGSLPKPAPAPEVKDSEAILDQVLDDQRHGRPFVGDPAPDLAAIQNPRERIRAKVGRYVELAGITFHGAWLALWRAYDAEMGFCSRRHAERYPSRLSWCFERGNVGVLENELDRLLAKARRRAR